MLKRKVHRIILFLLDALFITAALGLAYLIRRDFHIEEEYRIQFISILPFVLLIRLMLFYLLKLYKGMLRYASVSELIAIVASTTIGTVIFSICNVVMENFSRLGNLPLHPEGFVLRIPWAVVVMEWVFVILFIGGGRFSRRIVLTFGRGLSRNARRILIIGAGDNGEAVARQMMKGRDRGLKPVCFIDEDPTHKGRQIHNLPVVGILDDLPEAVERYRVDDVIVATPGFSPAKLRELVKSCKGMPVTFRIAPSMNDLIEGRIEFSNIRKVEIEDLLGREPVRLELPGDRNYLKGETALVTGAGGSIGSELCRQVLKYNPRRILLLGRGENSIYEIAGEFNYDFKTDKVIPVIADVQNEERMRQVFEEYKPGVVFHAAAHKHVPLMELYPQEAVQNNIFGTLNVARLADEYGVKVFVYISTDKAVHPTNVMGASKRMSELVIFTLAERSETDFVAVRFGNVLGSRGSVIPHFKRQIERGGPVTVTHPEVMRYFMTIPEAVSLVLQTGAMRDKGRLFLLDMGEPVKIVDLARNLIALSGFEPGEDIEIVFTGLRPGEKLIEELLTAGEGVQKTDMGKIFVTQASGRDWNYLMTKIDQLRGLCMAGDEEGIILMLQEIVPEFKRIS